MATGSLHRSSEFPYHFIGKQYVCAYCGDPADTVDHCVPSWFVQGNVAIIARSKLFKVSCCRECNMEAGMIVDRSFIARKQRIARNLRRKHASILRVAHWRQDEIAKLGYRLRTYVANGERLRRHLSIRLEELESLLMPEGMTDTFFDNIPTLPQPEFVEQES